MTQLYKISQQLVDLVNNADPETGVIDEQAFEGLLLEKEEKQLNVARFIRHLENDEEVLTQEKKRIEDMIRTSESRKEWLKKYLKTSMELDGKTELDFILFKAKIKQNPPSVRIVNENFIKPEYWVTKQVVSYDKAKIKEAIKSGVTVEGAELWQTNRLEVK
jgi:hypothetical protein